MVPLTTNSEGSLFQHMHGIVLKRYMYVSFGYPDLMNVVFCARVCTFVYNDGQNLIMGACLFKEKVFWLLRK